MFSIILILILILSFYNNNILSNGFKNDKLSQDLSAALTFNNNKPKYKHEVESSKHLRKPKQLTRTA